MGKSSFCSMEDCESTVTMRVRCRRGQLIVLFPVLILCSVLINIKLQHKHAQQLSRYSNSLDVRSPRFLSKGGSKTEMRKRATRKKSRRKMHKRPRIKPLPSSLSPNATFSACLLIKDDNDILNEWIAYHYFALNLRHLIVAVDPLSSQSPSDILRKWSELTDLQTLEWDDFSYMPLEFLVSGTAPPTDMQDVSNTTSYAALQEISNHRYRQRVFLAQCMKKHRQLGNSWVMHIDTDEFIVPSKLLRQMKPSYVSLPAMDEAGSALNLLQQAVAKTSSLVNYPCISMLRVLFGSVESDEEHRDNLVPEAFDSTTFETLRWRHHALPHNMSLNGNPKVIVDIAAIPDKYLPDVVFSIHRPITQFCSKNKDLAFTSFRKQPIGVNHYLGSWERYSGRQDKRRSRATYDAKANQTRGTDDGVRAWLKGFVQEMGEETSIKLLGEQYLSKQMRPLAERLPTELLEENLEASSAS